jgi:hypothetical protein
MVLSLIMTGRVAPGCGRADHGLVTDFATGLARSSFLIGPWKFVRLTEVVEQGAQPVGRALMALRFAAPAAGLGIGRELLFDAEPVAQPERVLGGVTNLAQVRGADQTRARCGDCGLPDKVTERSFRYRGRRNHPEDGASCT